ncbi:MAG TPA: NADH-quinone oxidoreductase subunit L [Bacteroidales bacterium]|nr:MAG: NADH dehydrogenase [Bacteroidetes bacterium GWE2_42_24]OFY31578.1 MAG: NADH dehydrogenase [Bacteroidetes bacterium GWF2_43_11]HBZ67171.1 NADH-quinone oxidoreductase subunit L [Bacteroidales bacterium]
MTNYSYTLLIPLIPLAIFLITGLAGHKFKPIVSGLTGTMGLTIAAFLSYTTAIRYFFIDGPANGMYPQIKAVSTVWLRFTDTLHIDLGILIDPISVMMLVVVTTVSLMAHIYSLGYMKGERGFARFYSFLSLFSFSMLGLVLATNIFQMYIFWELVGVSSFLLIGFYYEKPSAVAASKKAFIVTRFADLGFLIGILMLSFTTNTFDFITLTSTSGPIIAAPAGAAFVGISVVSWALILVFIGGAGKSAMFPLHIWLPDAMEGPTPVSALIHAATMVVAGVYLVARLFPAYALAAPDALHVVAWVGGFSSLFAAVIAITQIDIKRVLAFSTMSQIGYMMMALGVSGYGDHEGLGYMASMFHLFTHAMFKALLFLGAGSIIHAVHSNNMTDMGGLRKYLPITHITFLIACLTIAGIPPLSGFWSKDEILAAALHHNPALFAIGIGVAGLTAFYMFRLYYNVFWGQERHYHHTPHESPLVMTIPLMFLAFAAVFSGFLPFSHLVTSDLKTFETHTDLAVAIPSVLIALVGIGVATVMYRKPNSLPDRVSSSIKGLYTASFRKFWIDEVYQFVTKKIIFSGVSRPIAWFDRHVIDDTMNAVGWLVVTTSERIKGFQSGQVQQYAAVFVSSVVLLVLVFVYLFSN